MSRHRTEAVTEIDPRFFRVKDAATYAAISESEIYRSIYNKELRAFRYRSRTWLITQADVDEYLDQQTVCSFDIDDLSQEEIAKNAQ